MGLNADSIIPISELPSIAGFANRLAMMLPQGKGRGENPPLPERALCPRTLQTAWSSPSPPREERAGERRPFFSRAHGEGDFDSLFARAPDLHSWLSRLAFRNSMADSAASHSTFGYRISAFFRISGFGFRVLP
jgi:hypothetical protein